MVDILHTVYIVHQNTGSCLVSENFTETKIDLDSDLITSYLVAIKSYGAEMTKGSGDLKVIDMDVYNLFLIVQKGILTIGAADKADDKMIIYHNLSKLQSKFLKKYDSQGEMDYWGGQISPFQDFKEVMRRVLKDGQIGEVKKSIPIFKIYIKSFLKILGQASKKDLKIKEGDYNKALKIEDKSAWITDKKLPTQTLAQGLLNEHQYNIAHLVDGFKTADDIATETKLPIEDIYKVLKTIDDLGLLEYIELI